MDALFDNTPDEMIGRRKGEPYLLVASFGGGLNSTAGLALLKEIGDRPDAILFADVGDWRNGKPAEQPETYEHVDFMSEWCEANGFPPITWVRRDVDHEQQKAEAKYSTLEEECHVKRCLPSIAYFGRTCSMKWKQEPQAKWLRNWQPALDSWAAGRRVVKAIFFDADEPGRAKHWADDRTVNWYPLVDHDIGRDECVERTRRAGLPVPPKSSCYFCPEMTPPEIRDLEERHPDLLARALAMEERANLTAIKGLGKHEYSWREMVASRYTLPVVAAPRRPCVCDDGGGLFDSGPA